MRSSTATSFLHARGGRSFPSAILSKRGNVPRMRSRRGRSVTTATRSEALPDLPTIGDFVTGYEASTWNGVCAPKNTPADIVDRLNREINAGLADPTRRLPRDPDPVGHPAR